MSDVVLANPLQLREPGIVKRICLWQENTSFRDCLPSLARVRKGKGLSGFCDSQEIWFNNEISFGV